MTNVIGVRFKSGGKVYYFDPLDMTFAEGENVIIETARGVEFGTVAEGNHEVPDSSVVQPLQKVIRKATEQDEHTNRENREKEKRAFALCEEKIAQHGLDMKLVEVEYNFEGSKILFFFTSDGRVDFRELVKDLAGVFRTRIELRQIGVRDEAKLLGGLGICGRPFCCASFLGEFQPVSIKMAKVQNLSLNPTKISGTCGRLMCCLKYEQEAYEDAAKKLPKVNTPIDTPAGKGTVADVNLLRETVTVKYEDSPDKKTYKYDSLVNGEGEEYKPKDSRAKAPMLSESLLGIGFTAEDAFSKSVQAGIPIAPDAEVEKEPRQQEKKPAPSRKRRRGGRGKSSSGAAKAQSQVQPKPKTEVKPAQPKGQGGENKPQAKSGGSKSNRRRRSGSGKGQTQPKGQAQGQVKTVQPKPKTENKAPAPAASGAKGGSSNRNKYRGRAGNRPKTPVQNKPE